MSEKIYFYMKFLYQFSSNVRTKSRGTFAPKCLSYSSLMINLKCVCSGKNKQSKWSLFPIWALEFHFSLEWKLLLAIRGFFILSSYKWIFFYQTNNLCFHLRETLRSASADYVLWWVLSVEGCHLSHLRLSSTFSF